MYLYMRKSRGEKFLIRAIDKEFTIETNLKKKKENSIK